MENLQSAEKAYAQLAELQQKYADIEKMYNENNEKIKKLESGDELTRIKAENEELRKINKDISEKFISQSDMLNKMLISHGVPVDEKPSVSEEEKEAAEIMKKIEAQNGKQENK